MLSKNRRLQLHHLTIQVQQEAKPNQDFAGRSNSSS